ncbi:small ribosomal subunit protein uS17m [Cylas formicarius]|uniref:small ribosomal subunit protein uS17m n=1 Tax=Cylas formicarius TaxID=197179 RepID=UPI00295860AA|nr:small ribosomal subunit protein uS17m [Cylas formicarius]
MSLPPIAKTFMILGQCVPSMKQGVSRFKVRRLELDKNLNMYFPKIEPVFALDPDNMCKSGDIALLEILPDTTSLTITHKVKEILYAFGDVTDPITNKKVVAGKYRDHLAAVSKVYGANKNAFDYDKAPARGWQEEKKDYTHVETYIKYHEDGKDQPYAV